MALLPFDFGKITMKATEDRIELKGCLYYKEQISFYDVEEVLLLTEKPESSRIWGTGTKRFSLGAYCFNDYGNGTAMMDKEAEYFILVKRMNGKWFGFSVKDSEEMLVVYAKLKDCTGVPGTVGE